MGKNSYVVESDFDDLHGNPDDAPDLEVDLSDSENPIVMAAQDENWKPPAKDDEDKDDDEVADKDEEEDDDDGLVELDGEEDDDESGEDDDEEDDEEDDDEKYSKSVKKRIDRERALRLRDRQESDAKFARLEKKVELRDARDKFNSETNEAKAKLRKLKKQKIAALEEGQTEKSVDIDEEILDIKAELKAQEMQLKQKEDSIDDEPANATSNTPLAGKEWLDKYPQFHTNNTFKAVVLSADSMVAARGLDRNTPEYYEEMEKIIQPQFPDIIKLKKKGKVTTKGRKKKRGAVGAVQKAGVRRSSKRSRRGVIRLSKADQDNMEVFGMDPRNPADAKAWAESKGQ